MNDAQTQEVMRRPRGRPRKNPDALAHDQKKRGSQTSHGPEHYAEIRYKRELAGIIHKQFRILEEDVPEAEQLLSKLLKKANMAFHRVSLKESIDETIRSTIPTEVDPLVADLEPVALPQEPPTASLLEEKQEPPPEPAAKPKLIRERGKLYLKAFRKDAP